MILLRRSMAGVSGNASVNCFTVGVESEFEFLATAQAPVAIDDDLHQFTFARTDRLQVVLEACEERCVFVRVVGRQEDGAAGKPGSHSIFGRFREAGFGAETR